MRAELERIKPRGHGPDPLAEAYPVGRQVVADLVVTGASPGRDLVGDLLDEARKRREERPR